MSSPRSQESLRHHFEVEKELAAKLRASDREQRTELFKTLYTELFERVPDHPRLTRRETLEDSQRNTETQLCLLRPHLNDKVTLLEIAPGDCRLSHAAAPLCKKVIGVDISGQGSSNDVSPENFELVIYDGYNLELPDNSIDVAFSYQFLEHLHPDDVELHFKLIHRLLKPGGVYVFDSPHRYSGPHDVSRYFGDSLQCFHFQEWTYRQLRRMTREFGFSTSALYRKRKLWPSRFLNNLNDTVEFLVGLLPKSLRSLLSRRLFPAVTLAVTKER